jgi:hypothetical protein
MQTIFPHSRELPFITNNINQMKFYWTGTGYSCKTVCERKMSPTAAGCHLRFT